MNTAITNNSALILPTMNESANAMDNLPREVFNKVTGDRMKILHSVANGFDSIKIEFTLPPKAIGAPLHYHLNFSETFEVLSGRLEMRVGSAKAQQTLQKGDFIEVKPGTLHSFSNPHNESVVFVSEALPAAEFEKFIRSMFGLANDGKTNKDGMPTNFLHLATVLDFADLYFPLVPAWMQKTVRKTLRNFAEMTGAETELEKYFQANA